MRLLKIIAILFTLFIIFAIYSADTGTNQWLVRLVDYLPYKDRAGHLLLIGLLTFFVNLGLEIKTTLIFKRPVLLGSLIIFVLITIEEFSQQFLARRNFDLIDLLFNYLGIIIFSFLSVWVFNRFFKKEKI